MVEKQLKNDLFIVMWYFINYMTHFCVDKFNYGFMVRYEMMDVEIRTTLIYKP